MTNFKQKKFRCKKILQMAKGENCTHCGKNDGTTVAAHMNGTRSGRGIGTKANDYLVAYLCSECHYNYDNTRSDFYLMSATKQERENHRQSLFFNAMIKTLAIWVPRLIAPDLDTSQFCPACEAEGRGKKSKASHTCGIK